MTATYFTCKCPKDIQKYQRENSIAHLVPIDCFTEETEIKDIRKEYRFLTQVT